MDTKKFDKLYEELLALMAQGKEEEAKEFLIEHFEEFPKGMQDKLIMLFFEESLDKINSGQDQTIADFQKQGLTIMKELGGMKKGVEDKLKALEIEESLQTSDN